MAVEISKKEVTNPQSGIMHISDVHRVLTDFHKKVILDCTDPSRNPVQKRFYFDIDSERLSQIIKSPGNDKKIRINMSLNLPGQLDCELSDSIENNLSILVCGVDKTGNSMLKDGDLILVEGFKDSKDTKIGDRDCCVQGKPFFD